MHTESEWRFGTYSMPKSAKCPTFNAIISAPLLPIIWIVIMGESSGSRPWGTFRLVSMCKRRSSLIVTSMRALDGPLWA